nr:hypothetical protein [Tanacetum cinerariifolium]
MVIYQTMLRIAMSKSYLLTAVSDIRASTTIDGTSTPVSRIFDRLRNISTSSLQNPDEVSQNVTLQPPFRTGAGTTVALNDSPLSVRRRLTTGAAIVYANVSSAPSSDGHYLDTDVFENRRMTYGSQTMPLRHITVETTIPVQLEYADASFNTCTQVVSASINRNSLWQHVKNRCVKPQVINLPHRRRETSDLTIGHQHVASKPMLNEVFAANESVATNTRKWKNHNRWQHQSLKKIHPVEVYLCAFSSVIDLVPLTCVIFEHFIEIIIQSTSLNHPCCGTLPSCLFAVIDNEFEEWAWSCELTSFWPAAATVRIPASLWFRSYASRSQIEASQSRQST